MPAMPIATYRLQLREGIDLDRASALLPWLVDLGVSHLYLAPPFHAASGSTHGYDVIDPTCIDPDLGGDEAFVRLSDAAQAAGIGIVIDIVPNHMAFTPENPFLADVLRHGRDSRYAAVFDIDWTKGPIHFPVLDGEPADLLAQGQITLGGTPDAPALRVYDRDYPLCEIPQSAALDAESLDALLARQHWSLGHWRTSTDRIVHRRFFNITDLIGVRQEDPDVFALTHRWIIEQVSAGRIQALRVDHVDGLACPGGYLHALREAVGDIPVWVEKIVKPGETMLATWPVEGMSGYEFMGPLTRFLTNPEGLAAMRTAARGAVPADTAQEIRKVRHELLTDVFGPEVARVTQSAMAALAAAEDTRAPVTAEIVRLASAWPVYRSYAADLAPLTPQVTDAVRETRADALLGLLRAPDDPLARAFAARFEQLTGALTAKSEEDTVFFRSVAFLPLCEVGSEPDLSTIDAQQFAAMMADRAGKTPLALTALSTHDTKRSADARAVLIALSHFPQVASELYHTARTRAVEAELPECWGLYALQTALMMRGQDDADTRITAHIAKAMREAKDVSRHEEPNAAAETTVAALATALHGEISEGTLLPPGFAAQFDAAVEAITLAQVTLQITAPGVPDIYQGTEGLAVALTDPDNRRAVAWDELAAMPGTRATVAARKLALTRELIALRRANPAVFTQGSYRLVRRDGALLVEREWEGTSITVPVSTVAPTPCETTPREPA